MTLREDIIEVLSRRSPAYLLEIRKDLARMGIEKTKQCIYMCLKQHSVWEYTKHSHNALPYAFRRVEDPNGGMRHAWALVSHKTAEISDIVPMMTDILHRSKYALSVRQITRRLQKKLDKKLARYDASYTTVRRILSTRQDLFKPHGGCHHSAYSLVGESKTKRKKIVSHSLTWYVRRVFAELGVQALSVYDIAKAVLAAGYETGSKNPQQCIASCIAKGARTGKNFRAENYGTYSLIGDGQ